MKDLEYLINMTIWDLKREKRVYFNKLDECKNIEDENRIIRKINTIDKIKDELEIIIDMYKNQDKYDFGEYDNYLEGRKNDEFR